LTEIVARSMPDKQFRPGGRVLSLFSSAQHGLILRSLAEGPVDLHDLARRAGVPNWTGLRGNIGNLIGLGALEKRGPDGEPGVLDNALTPFGYDLLSVGTVLDAWLVRAPSGPLGPETADARDAIRALTSAWGSTILRALAVRSLSVSELDDLLGSLTYPAIARRITAMGDAGLVETAGEDGRGPAYAPTRWLREAMGPLMAAMRCESLHLDGQAMSLGRIDVETLFLLTVPIVGAVDATDGDCQLVVQLDDRDGGGSAGVRVSVDDGAPVSCVSRLDEGLEDQVTGPVPDWLPALVDGAVGGLDGNGSNRRSTAMVEALHGRLYRPAP
jgi:DNA-binding HxlR family transcriptional regulator